MSRDLYFLFADVSVAFPDSAYQELDVANLQAGSYNAVLKWVFVRLILRVGAEKHRRSRGALFGGSG